MGWCLSKNTHTHNLLCRMIFHLMHSHLQVHTCTHPHTLKHCTCIDCTTVCRCQSKSPHNTIWENETHQHEKTCDKTPTFISSLMIFIHKPQLKTNILNSSSASHLASKWGYSSKFTCNIKKKTTKNKWFDVRTPAARSCCKQRRIPFN